MTTLESITVKTELPKWWTRLDIQTIVKVFSTSSYKSVIETEDIETMAKTLGLFVNDHVCMNRLYSGLYNSEKLLRLDLIEQHVDFNEAYFRLTKKCLDLLGIVLKFDDKGLAL